MSGPSLKKQEAHTSIHEAALNEARELNALLRKCLVQGEKEKAFQVAEVMIEHWETRTLNHAKSEEEELYKELVEENPDMKNLVLQLTRDHDLLRRIVGQIKDLLVEKEIEEKICSLADSLIVIDEIHNEDEMNKLLAQNKR